MNFEIERLDRQQQAEERMRLFSQLGGFYCNHSRYLMGFRTAEGARAFKALYPEWETFLLVEEKVWP